MAINWSILICLFATSICNYNVAATCNDLVLTNVASITYSDNTTSGNNHATNVTAQFTCASNYVVISGSTSGITCLDNNTWTSYSDCVGRYVDLDKLRTLSRDNAKKQKWWVDWDELGISQTQISVMLGTLICLIGVGLGVGSFYLQRSWLYKPLHKRETGIGAASLFLR